MSIHQDEDPESPRSWTNAGIMVCWHPRYELGDRKPEDNEMEALKRGGFPLLTRYLRRYAGATHVIPLGLLDHSGLHMYADGGSHWSDSAGWDSGTVGFIYDTPQSRADTGMNDELIDMPVSFPFVEGVTPTHKVNAIDYALRGDVETYDHYLRGDVYGFTIETPDGEHVDSCWGFYGFDYCKAEALEIAKGLKPVTRRRVHLGPNRTLTAHFGATA